MENPDLTEENDSDSATFSFEDLCAKLPEQGFDVPPLNVGARWMGEQKCERALMLPLHGPEWYQRTVL